MAKQQFPKTRDEAFDMIYDRKPDQEGRATYGNQIGNLFTYLEKMIPKDLKGLIKLDVLWFERPEIRKGNFQIMPNKVLYEIPIKSELGKKVAQSNCGIVIHSMYDDPTAMDSHAIENFDALGLLPVKGLVVLTPKLQAEIEPDKKSIMELQELNNFIKKNSKKIDKFFDRTILGKLKITDLAGIMKTFMASLSRMGKDSSNLDKVFLAWLTTAKLSEVKKQNILMYIENNYDAYLSIMLIVEKITKVKNNLFDRYQQSTTHIKASIGGVSSHEGYVVSAPEAIIKIVNRPLFMRY
jgi:hypothetical protein